MKIHTDYLIPEGVNKGEHFTVYERPCFDCGKAVLINKDFYDQLKASNQIDQPYCLECRK